MDGRWQMNQALKTRPSQGRYWVVQWSATIPNTHTTSNASPISTLVMSIITLSDRLFFHLPLIGKPIHLQMAPSLHRFFRQRSSLSIMPKGWMFPCQVLHLTPWWCPCQCNQPLVLASVSISWWFEHSHINHYHAPYSPLKNFGSPCYEAKVGAILSLVKSHTLRHLPTWTVWFCACQWTENTQPYCSAWLGHLVLPGNAVSEPHSLVHLTILLYPHWLWHLHHNYVPCRILMSIVYTVDKKVSGLFILLSPHPFWSSQKGPVGLFWDVSSDISNPPGEIV